MRLCPGCSSSDSLTLNTPIRETTCRVVLKCNSCGMVFLKEVAGKEFYDHDKQSEFVNSIIKENYGDRCNRDTLRRVNICRDYIINKKVLDIGCGYGFFVRAIIGIADKIMGLDLSRHRVDYLHKQYPDLDIRQTEISDLAEKFDVITMFHVLEHIEYPTDYLRQVYEKLEDNGFLIVEVPSLRDVLVNLPAYKKFYFQRAHCNYFNYTTLKSVLRNSGFTISEYKKIQRYSLDNHLNWLINRGPGKIKFGILNKLYSGIVKFMCLNDTILVICSKEIR